MAKLSLLSMELGFWGDKGEPAEEELICLCVQLQDF